MLCTRSATCTSVSLFGLSNAACLCWTSSEDGVVRFSISQKTPIGGGSTEEVLLDHSDIIGVVFQDWTGFIALSRND
ncbi:uncharacterized protein HD556DRAFT_1422947, partial [Suillus plorans]